MSWDDIPDEYDLFAQVLSALPDTERTGQALYSIQSWLRHTWFTSKSLLSPSGIPIPPPRNKALHPTQCELSGADIQFEFKLGDSIALTTLPELSQFQVRVTGDVAYPACIVELEDHWRVDTHSFEGTPLEPHAFIHFQRGGHAQDAWAGRPNYVPGPALPTLADASWRALLQTPGPRIPVPPLCPMLAIDFVIGQHDGNVWKRLRNQPEYRDLIAAAQARLWAPFFDGLATEASRRRWLGPVLI